MSKLKTEHQAAKYPCNPWGPLADDPWSPVLDVVTGPVWDAAVADARKKRLAAQRAEESVKRLERERDTERAKSNRD